VHYDFRSEDWKAWCDYIAHSQFRRAVRDDLPLLQRVIERHEAEAQ
jgi:hypothetical protein